MHEHHMKWYVSWSLLVYYGYSKAVELTDQLSVLFISLSLVLLGSFSWFSLTKCSDCLMSQEGG